MGVVGRRAGRLRWLWRPGAQASLLWLIGLGCAPWGQAHYRALRRDLAGHRFAQGLARVDQARAPLYGSKEEVLYWLDRGVLAAAAGDWAASIAAYEAAKALQQKLYTQHVTDHALALLVGERKLPYVPEPFEQVACHMLEADAYLRLHALEEAGVELRQMQGTLERCRRAAAKSHSSYADDAAGRWLSGLLREADRRELGHLSEARIDLTRAEELFERVDSKVFATAVPKALKRAKARVDAALQGKQEASLQAGTHESAKLAARAVLLYYDGVAPHKEEAFWLAVVPTQIIRVAYPIFVPDERRPKTALLLDRQSGSTAPAELASNFAEKARVDLAERMAGIHDRAVARAMAKYAASEALMVGGAIGGGAALELLGLGLSITNAVTEHADVRAWQTLPARMWVAEMTLPSGPYDLAVMVDGASEPLAHFAGQASAGETLFFSARAY